MPPDLGVIFARFEQTAPERLGSAGERLQISSLTYPAKLDSMRSDWCAAASPCTGTGVEGGNRPAAGELGRKERSNWARSGPRKNDTGEKGNFQSGAA
ncbi:hypothetical protein VNI00_007639 [Paramarasmius palmivorus]|uniref:Uncharacterized protein n=1 Tax=Paramarasmius palmivorus TaxID=297713 RepID=A0AAW0D1Y0_9AGAR